MLINYMEYKVPDKSIKFILDRIIQKDQQHFELRLIIIHAKKILHTLNNLLKNFEDLQFFKQIIYLYCLNIKLKILVFSRRFMT